MYRLLDFLAMRFHILVLYGEMDGSIFLNKSGELQAKWNLADA